MVGEVLLVMSSVTKHELSSTQWKKYRQTLTNLLLADSQSRSFLGKLNKASL